jgi:uncharacterized membrane protein YdcZ (DUF606 family)
MSNDESCPHCKMPLEIVSVKFRFGSTVLVSRCPNCAIVTADEPRLTKAKGRHYAPKLGHRVLGLMQAGLTMLEALNLRVKHIVAVLIAAFVIAALLRHTVHVYAGFSREEIRLGALVAVVVISAGWMFLRRKNPG